MSRTAGLVWVALVVGAVCCSAAAARTHPTITGPTRATLLGEIDRSDEVLTDLRRFIAFRHRASLRVYDLQRRSSYDIAACDGIGGAADGKFLLACGPAGYRILDARTRSMLPVPGTEDNDQLQVIGAHWIFGINCVPDANKCPGGVFINWRTGERRECDTYLDEGCDSESVDLNSPRLASLREWPESVVGVQPPYILRLFLTGPPGFQSYARLVLSTHGHKRLVERGWFCREEDCAPMLNAGRVSWTHQNWGRTRSVLLAEGLRSRRRYRWFVRDGHRFSADGSPSGEPRIDQIHMRWGIALRVNATLDRPIGGGDRREPLSWWLYALPWPTRRAGPR